MAHVVEPEIVGFAHALADASGEIVRQAVREPRVVHAKADASPVTEVDRAVERTLREMIEARYPEHGIYGEEYGVHNPDAEHVWVLDPIDGTKAFLIGLTAYATLVALTRRDRPVLGVIDQPITGERWVGIDGDATYLDGEPVRTRACARLADAVATTTSPDYYHGDDVAALERMTAATRWMVYGGNAIVFGTLATGLVDVAFEARVGPYDYCALVPVVTNAGGVMSDWEGRPLTLRSGPNIVASGDPALHAQVLACLNGGPVPREP